MVHVIDVTMFFHLVFNFRNHGLQCRNAGRYAISIAYVRSNAECRIIQNVFNYVQLRALKLMYIKFQCYVGYV